MNRQLSGIALALAVVVVAPQLAPSANAYEVTPVFSNDRNGCDPAAGGHNHNAYHPTIDGNPTFPSRDTMFNAGGAHCTFTIDPITGVIIGGQGERGDGFLRFGIGSIDPAEIQNVVLTFRLYSGGIAEGARLPTGGGVNGLTQALHIYSFNWDATFDTMPGAPIDLSTQKLIALQGVYPGDQLAEATFDPESETWTLTTPGEMYAVGVTQTVLDAIDEGRDHVDFRVEGMDFFGSPCGRLCGHIFYDAELRVNEDIPFTTSEPATGAIFGGLSVVYWIVRRRGRA